MIKVLCVLWYGEIVVGIILVGRVWGIIFCFYLYVLKKGEIVRKVRFVVVKY